MRGYANRDPGVRLQVATPVEALDGELVVAGSERRAVERNAHVAVGVLADVVDHPDPPLVDAVDGDAERLVGRTRLVDLQVGELRVGAADGDGRRVGGARAVRQHTDLARTGCRVQRLILQLLHQI